ncbi:hypothetical protein KIN20_026733 [Parelaphostrongylus tenuis]|uniref:Uncharacterized protein n=1 Tax=Parelaphostrongylus tenuis TaxID=148309 RepID=A0AAD5QYE8_PARTN|nr:hypothetical protein KIN20_026733 [Parelaphostrongylus tenuis]
MNYIVKTTATGVVHWIASCPTSVGYNMFYIMTVIGERNVEDDRKLTGVLVRYCGTYELKNEKEHVPNGLLKSHRRGLIEVMRRGVNWPTYRKSSREQWVKGVEVADSVVAKSALLYTRDLYFNPVSWDVQKKSAAEEMYRLREIMRDAERFHLTVGPLRVEQTEETLKRPACDRCAKHQSTKWFPTRGNFGMRDKDGGTEKTGIELISYHGACADGCIIIHLGG